MTLLELTEPIFQLVCRLNRLARQNASAASDYGSVRSEVQDLFADMAEKSRQDLRLHQQYESVELPLIFFVDSMIAESALPFAMEWNQNRLAFEREELAGDQKFFDLLDEALTQRKEDATERLAVFYTCLGLGFSGWHSGQPDVLRRKMLEIAPGIRGYLESDESVPICGDAYEHTDTTILPLSVGLRLAGLGIIFVGLILVVVFANITLFRTSSADLSRALEAVASHDPASPSGKR